MKNTQQERLEKRILNIINKKLKFLEKKVVEKDWLGEIKFPVITKENKSMEVLEEEGLQIIADALSTVECELQTSLRHSFKYEKIVFSHNSKDEKNFRIDFKRLDSKKICVRIDMKELDNDEGYYFKPFVMIH